MNKLPLFSKTSQGANILVWMCTFVFLLLAGAVQAQEEEAAPEKDTRPVRNTFESVWLIDNQTVMVPIKGTFEMDIQHRFGTMDNGYDDFWGFYAPSNIRLGFSYVPVEKLQVGFGFTKERKMWDFSAKYALFQQGREGGWPVSVTYFVNAGIDTRNKKNFPDNTYEGSDRLSYFHQLMVARKISKAFSLQASVNVAHFNFQELVPSDADPETLLQMENDNLSLSFLGRLKVSPTLSVIANYDLPLTDNEVNNPNPNLSFGIEAVSSSHAFQIFVGQNYNIVPQLNNTFNWKTNPDKGFLIGFNITRLWNF
ncbi:MAG: hypothetical protein KDC66_16650 [Phaeodactylibacter sp.]|nr:hypothetical protein [Phaeodactylibacter sp.]MCB9274997.1 hypothetical protein [Lewinellaceae bacterium]